MKCKVCGRPPGTTDTDFEEIYGIHAGPCEHREPMTGAEYQQLVAFDTNIKEYNAEPLPLFLYYQINSKTTFLPLGDREGRDAASTFFS